MFVMPCADMAETVDDALAEQDAVGRREISEQGRIGRFGRFGLIGNRFGDGGRIVVERGAHLEELLFTPVWFRHCEERSDEAIQRRGASLDCFAALAMTA
jgi:hypothetical protein